ncbi:MAG: hypothetical protein NTV23_02115 [Propionibacteriales bacterium]|nr:hypothetical protein [Propionibacteriales bacterium]
MTHRRTILGPLAAVALLLSVAGCSDDAPQGVGTPAAGSATTTPPAPSASSTPTATATATATKVANQPLTCPETMAVIAATRAVLNEQGESSPTMCTFGSSNTSATGSIQSEEAFGSRSLQGYRTAMRAANGKIKGIRTAVKDRPDFGIGAFQVTFTGGRSGAITNLVVPRPNGQFASVSASRVKDGKFLSDLALTEGLARAFLDG